MIKGISNEKILAMRYGTLGIKSDYNQNAAGTNDRNKVSEEVEKLIRECNRSTIRNIPKDDNHFIENISWGNDYYNGDDK